MSSYPKFQNKTLILPSLSYGLCDSLALDLIIYNLKFQKVANLDFKYLYPVAFNLEEINGGVALPCELYEKDRYVILQIRSTIATGATKEFMKQLEDFISGSSFDDVICLSSVNIIDIVKDNTSQIKSNLFYYTNSDETSKRLSEKFSTVSNVNELFGKYKEDVEKNAIRGISRRVKKIQTFNKTSLTIIYGLTRSTIDLEASAVLAKFLIQSLELNFTENLKAPSYFRRLYE